MTSSTGPDEWEWWWSKWRNRIRCGACRALMLLSAPCPVCGQDYRNLKPTEHVVGGRTITIPPAFAGALDWSPYVMLQLMQREWLRPLTEENKPLAMPLSSKPSARVLVLLIFWTYFETLMGWFYETATSHIPSGVAADLLRRYNSIGSRRDRLHRILFQATYKEDLNQVGGKAVWLKLEEIQQQRNAFMHGNPEAIDDRLVEDTVKLIPDFHEAWIQSFNLRCAKRP